MGSLEEIGGSAPVTGSEPGLSVTERADGEAYTVTSGARALAISNPDGAVLSTTVELASDGSAVTVTDSNTTSPSWTAPSGGTDGDAVAVRVSATAGGLSSSVGFTERVAGTGGGGRSWQVYKDFDLTTGVSQGPYTAGSGANYVLTDTGGGWSLTVNLKSGGNAGTMELINGTGLKLEGVNATSGVVSAAFLLSEEIPDLDYEWLCSDPMCVQIVIDDYDIQGDDLSGFIVGLNNTTSYSSGKLRALFFQARTGGGGTEERSIRTNGSNTGIADLPSLPPATRRMDFVLTDGDRMSANVYDGVGEADPATDFFDLSGNYLQCGSWGLSRNTTTTVYTSTMRLVFAAAQKLKCTIKAIRILQYKVAP